MLRVSNLFSRSASLSVNLNPTLRQACYAKSLRPAKRRLLCIHQFFVMTTPTIDLTGDLDETASPTSSDEDLRRAIAISLEAAQTMPNSREAELDATATSPTRIIQ